MARNKLTATQVKSLTKTGKHGDGDGLYLFVSKTGRKSWVFVYIRGGRRREMGLGPLEGVSSVSLSAAREKADEVRAILGRGGDPFEEMAERQARKVAPPFGMISDQYIEAYAPGWKNSKHRDQWVMTMREYARPIRKLPVDQIETEHVVRILRPIWTDKRETARRVRSRIEIVLNHATARGLRSGDNPARWKGHLENILPREKKGEKKHHAALPYPEVPHLLSALRSTNGTGARALEFTILTACRTGEVLGARWDEFDLQNSVWTVPGDRMKAGKEHRVPLPGAALSIVETMSRYRLNDFVFPGQRQDSPISNMTMTKALKALVPTGATVHGFRSSFRDWAGEETSFPREIAEQALAHTVGDQVELAYRRGDALEKRRALMEAWASFVSPSDDRVVRIHG